jgi:Flp pilus assembly protein TadB
MRSLLVAALLIIGIVLLLASLIGYIVGAIVGMVLLGRYLRSRRQWSSLTWLLDEFLNLYDISVMLRFFDCYVGKGVHADLTRKNQ